jgi:hypothetical protein
MSKILLQRLYIVNLSISWIYYLRNLVLVKVWQKLLVCYKNAFVKILYM